MSGAGRADSRFERWLGPWRLVGPISPDRARSRRWVRDYRATGEFVDANGHRTTAEAPGPKQYLGWHYETRRGPWVDA